VTRTSRLGALFPWPFVGVALLVGVLIVVTPLLSANSQPAAGSLGSQALLIIDALPGNASMHFYVRGEGTTARYESINLGFAFGFNWTGGFPSGSLNWTDWQNASSTLAVNATVDRAPLVVNVAALYTANGVSALYLGVLAVDVGTPPGTSTETLSVISDTPGISGFTYAVADLPIIVPLSNVGSGGGP
jgi:hypothetical protein